MKYEIIQKQLAALGRRQEELEHLLRVLAAEPDTLEDKMHRLYIYFGKLPDVAKHLNDQGLRRGARKYVSKDIREILREGHSSVDPSVREFAFHLFETNSNSRWGKNKRAFDVRY